MFLTENWEISEILDDIILGRNVKRSVHDLEYDNALFTGLFVDRLRLYKFSPFPMNKIQIEVEHRAPAFVINGKTAIFGYVFWEVFSEKQKRKIFGSVAKNDKGDWKYVLNGNSSDVVFVNMTKLEEVDIYHLI